MTPAAVLAPDVAAPRRGALAVVALGAGALLARPALVGALPHPDALLVVLFLALGLAGTCWPLRTRTLGADHDHVPAAEALALGVAAFAVARLAGATTAVALPPRVAAVALNALAAVAEEAFFRRLLYGLLAERGTAVAVIGSAALFAAVHVTVWGVAVLPLDLAAGLLLGWQRAVSGRWSVPAVTHVAANLLAVL